MQPPIWPLRHWPDWAQSVMTTTGGTPKLVGPALATCTGSRLCWEDVDDSDEISSDKAETQWKEAGIVWPKVYV